MTSKQLAGDILEFVHESTTRAVERYLPGLHVPGFFAGQRIAQDFAVDLCVVLTLLHEAGYKSVGTRPIVELIRSILPQLDGTKIKTFYSYRLAETLQAFGGLSSTNPVLTGLSDDTVHGLKQAVDTTDIYDRAAGSLKGLPNNYWCVLARCEHARTKLGLVEDGHVYQTALAKTRELLKHNPAGFFDDDNNLVGRYDIYSADVLLFAEPMWELLGRDAMQRILETHVRLLETIAMPNGACVAWGRSTGALSVCMTAELATAGLHHGAGDPARLLHLAAHAFERFTQDWMSDDLISAHRGRMTEAYRGPARLLQMTFDCLQKWAWAALQLRQLDHATEPLTRRELFPHRDELIKFESRPAGLWMYRDRSMEFQLPVVQGYNGNYVTAPVAPGLFDMPVDSQMFIGVPRIVCDGFEYSAVRLPTTLEHSPRTLKVTGQPLSVVGKVENDTLHVLGTRDATWRVDSGTLHLEERYTFDHVPQALSFTIAETDTPLTVEWQTAWPHVATIVNVEAMPGYTTAWSKVKRLHQFNLVRPPAGMSMKMSFRVSITPAMQVAQGPATHDYNRGMYDQMPAGSVVETPFEYGIRVEQKDEFLSKFERAGILHIGWPEHLFPGDVPRSEQLRLHERVLHELKRRGVKIVWTMHNRRPHAWPADEGVALYRLWAPAVDALLHHSEWGKGVMLNDYAFRPDVLHELIPHGHFGRQMQISSSRAELEAKFNLSPCAIRFGILGRYQPEKQIELMLEAFHLAARPDQQLVLTAYDDKTVVPVDPRIIKLPRKQWQTRQEIAEQNHLCDALVAAQTGNTYLTSGMVGDAVGVGSAMVVPEWGFYREIAGDAGLFHDNTVDSLTRLFRDVTPAQIESAKRASRALQPAYDWKNLSPRVLGVLRELNAH